MLTQGRQPWGMDAEVMMLLSLASWAGGQLDMQQATWMWVLAEMRPRMNSRGLKIPSQEQSFLRIEVICFWQNSVSFFESEKKNGVGKALEISQDLLDMNYVLQNTFLTSWVLTNQNQTDCLSRVGFKMQQGKCHCWIWLGTCWTQAFAKERQSPYNERTELGLLVPLCRMWLQPPGRKKNEHYQIKSSSNCQWRVVQRKI